MSGKIKTTVDKAIKDCFISSDDYDALLTVVAFGNVSQADEADINRLSTAVNKGEVLLK